MQGRVLGADVWDGRWVGVVLEEGAAPRALVAPTVAELVARAEDGGPPLAVVGLDIPVGLQDDAPRAADLAARRVLGPRASSVFATPVRAALVAPDHAEAVRVSRAAIGAGVSVQAYGLRHRVLEVDGWVRAVGAEGAGGRRVVEVHPEVSFAAMDGGRPLAARKKSWAGAVRRRSLLAAHGVVLPDELGEAGAAAVDDVLDAAAVAWTARRVARGEARSLPDPPERTPDGWDAAIWT
ncbi:DUF429 domain-containing protein [Quadrisphaera sp. INWT6]|uniref:DUF429 domain-containing protein n=1 Tax=Quadrisphaera sp. INWT6 TaxID=2596917 RepID=UPI0018920167|nr:DUF429 domain-containing protein [Quadrisphaera sp. INWT6]MBF5082761.1 DUF429 domain-containing protein [Quadrisphaera sp. INWT6]